MSRFSLPFPEASVRQQLFLLVGFLALSTVLASLSGCDNSTNVQQSTTVDRNDPQAKFEWGVERLKRALRNFRPSSADGLSVIERKVAPELFPPTDTKPNYTARITVTSETAYLHGKRTLKSSNQEEEVKKEEPELLDPLAQKKDDYEEMIDLPGIGPKVPPLSAKIDTRSVGKETVFELAYLEGRWQLTKEPELKHEKLWFEYAFE